MKLFKLRSKLPKRQNLLIFWLGTVLILSVWQGLVSIYNIPTSILPSPQAVVLGLGELWSHDQLLINIGYSLRLNILGYLEAIALSIILGFIMGLIPLFRALGQGWVDAARFIPLTAITGIFIAWLGIGDSMKIHFLAFGIGVYLLPIIVQRIDEVEDYHLQTIWTLGANRWQTIRYVFFPSVISKVFDDIRVITAISWTYIIVAEMINKSGGVGSLIFVASRQSRLDKVFAILVIIILIGFIQDKIFKVLDKSLFPHKYA
jgi:NitT/TauT family transport system permease protein